MKLADCSNKFLIQEFIDAGNSVKFFAAAKRNRGIQLNHLCEKESSIKKSTCETIARNLMFISRKGNAMKDHIKKSGSGKEYPTGKGPSNASDNFQIEYAGGKYFKLVGRTKTEFTPDRELLSKMMAALRKRGMTLDDIADDQPPVDFQVLSSGKVVLRQIIPDK